MAWIGVGRPHRGSTVSAPAARGSRRFWPGERPVGHSLISVDDRDRLIALSIAAGTLAIAANLIGGALGRALFIAFGALAVTCLALCLSPCRRALSWLRSRALRTQEWLLRPLRRRQPQPELPTSAVTGCWQFTTDGLRHPQLARIGMDGFGHPAYSRPVESTPPFVRVKALVACSQLAEEQTWQNLRGRFLGLVTHEWLMTLISELTVIGGDAIWRSRATNVRRWLEADLTGADEKEGPVASAKLLLPEPGPGLFGTDRRCAELSLHVDLLQLEAPTTPVRERRESMPVMQGLPFWRKQVTRALTMSADLDGFLRHDLGVTTSNDPPVQFGFYLHAPGPLTQVVSTGNIRVLPAQYTLNEYVGFAIAHPGGETTEEIAGRIMLDLSERVLHLDGPLEEMSGLVPSGGAADHGLSSRT